jgi:hypothetical protein
MVSALAKNIELLLPTREMKEILLLNRTKSITRNTWDLTAPVKNPIQK